MFSHDLEVFRNCSTTEPVLGYLISPLTNQPITIVTDNLNL